MSQIINAIPPDALLPVAGALVGWCAHMLWFRAERAHVASGMARIRKFMRGNDEWLGQHQQRHVKAYAIEADKPHDAEVLHVAYPTQELPLHDGVFTFPNGLQIVQTTHPEHLPLTPQVAAGLDRLADEVGLVQALADQPHHDDEDAPADDTERPHLWVLIAVGLLMVGPSLARHQFKALWAYLRDRFKSNDALAAEWSTPAEVEYAGRRRSDEQSTSEAYNGRRVHPDFVTGIHPIVIPKQRDGEVQA